MKTIALVFIAYVVCIAYIAGVIGLILTALADSKSR